MQEGFQPARRFLLSQPSALRRFLLQLSNRLLRNWVVLCLLLQDKRCHGVLPWKQVNMFKKGPFLNMSVAICIESAIF